MFTQQWALLEESLTRKFDTPLWFLTLGNSTEFQVTVNLSKPFPICPSLLLCLLFAHLKDCVLCKCVCACACVRACVYVYVCVHEWEKKTDATRWENCHRKHAHFLFHRSYFQFVSLQVQKSIASDACGYDCMEAFLILSLFSFFVSHLFSWSASVHAICRTWTVAKSACPVIPLCSANGDSLIIRPWKFYLGDRIMFQR